MLADQLDETLSPRPTDGPTVDYAITTDGGRCTLLCDHRLLLEGGWQARTVDTLGCHVNQQAIAGAAGDHVVHAAAAARDGEALLPGKTEAGKTTLVTGLVGRRRECLTDEAVALPFVTAAMWPYPKPLSVDPGSSRWSAACVRSPRNGRRRLTPQWQAPPSALGARRSQTALGPRAAGMATKDMAWCSSG